jgi:chloramphenicol O-acetyltransferase
MGFSWEDIKNTPAHYIKQYIADIERAKNHFKGLNKGDAKKFSLAAQASGIPAN